MTHAAHCRHCGQKLARKSSAAFCCHGCETAYDLIHRLGLGRYYDLAAADRKQPAQESATERLGYLDSDEFRRQAVKKRPDGTESAHLDLHGLTCYACVWLVEHAAAQAGLSCQTRVNLSLGRAEIIYDPHKTPLSRIAQLIESLGYRVSASADTSSVDQRDILRLGVAWFCFLNVMAIAFADYLDPTGQIDATLAQFFRWISLALTLPAVFYSGMTFYEKAWVNLRQRRVAIDQSISVSIFLVFGYSVAATVVGRGPIYFDSVCAGIALLLTARLCQQRILRRTQQEVRSILEPAEKFVRLTTAEAETTIPLAELRQGDVFRVLPGEWIPVSARVVAGSGEINLEPLTGEAKWLPVEPGSSIHSGAFNGASPLTLAADEAGNQGYWQGLSSAVDRLLETKGRMKDFSDRVAVFFLFLVNGLALAVFVAFAWHGNVAEGARRAFSLALIACPCAFGLAAPLVFSACAAKALRQGILFKSQRAIEELARARHFVFDKTGTLTEGRLKVLRTEWQDDALAAAGFSKQAAQSYLAVMTAGSHHAAAQAIREDLGVHSTHERMTHGYRLVENFGSGLTFQGAEGAFRLGRAAYACGDDAAKGTGGSEVYFSFEHRQLACFVLDDELRSDAESVVTGLKKRGCQLEILSGDSTARAEAMARRLALYEGVRGGAKPEDKAVRIRRVARRSPVVMVGNGSNDSLAMAEATVSIAVAPSTSASRHAADVCLTKPGLTPCWQAIVLAAASQSAFRRTIAFAFAYNLAGIFLAVAGLVTPGVAAALMPLSSLCIVMLATRWRGEETAGVP